MIGQNLQRKIKKPDKKILDYSKKKLTFIGTNKTIYLCNESHDEEIKNNLDFKLDEDVTKINKWIRFESEWNEEKVNYEKKTLLLYEI